MSKRYDKEFKIYAAKLVVEQGKKAAEAASELDIAQQTLSKWVLQYREAHAEAFVGSGYLKPEDKATRELEKRIKDLQEENEILKKAMGIFAKSQR